MEIIVNKGHQMFWEYFCILYLLYKVRGDPVVREQCFGIQKSED